MENLHIVGAGGIGGWIIDLLNEKLPMYMKKNLQIYLYDGDIVETKNLIRQNFLFSDVGTPKVEALALAYPRLNIHPVKSYIKEIPFIDTSKKGTNGISSDVVVCAIDKARERVAFSKQCQVNNTIYIDVGNNIDDGQLVVEGISKNKGLCALYPEIIDKSYNESFMSCATVSESSPQILQVNFLGAELVVDNLIALEFDGIVGNYEYNLLGDIAMTLKHDWRDKDGSYYDPLYDGLSEDQLNKIQEIYKSSVGKTNINLDVNIPQD